MSLQHATGSGCFDEDYELEEGPEGGGEGGDGAGGEGAPAAGGEGAPAGDGVPAGEPAAADGEPAAPDGGGEPAAAPDGDGEPAAPAGSPDPTAADWNGDINTLDKLDGWGQLDEGLRTRLHGGLSRILKGWQRTYNGKLQEVAQDRERNERDREEIHQLEQTWLKMVSGEEDPLASKDARISELEAELAQLKEAGAAGASGDVQAAVAKAKGVWDAERDTLVAERDDVTARLNTLRTSVQGAYHDYLAEWLNEHAPDLADDAMDAAMKLWLDLHAEGETIEDALKMVRTKYPEPVRAPGADGKPEEVPDAIALQNMGDRDAKQTYAGKTLSEINEALRRETTDIAPWPQAQE